MSKDKINNALETADKQTISGAVTQEKNYHLKKFLYNSIFAAFMATGALTFTGCGKTVEQPSQIESTTEAPSVEESTQTPNYILTEEDLNKAIEILNNFEEYNKSIKEDYGMGSGDVLPAQLKQFIHIGKIPEDILDEYNKKVLEDTKKVFSILYNAKNYKTGTAEEISSENIEITHGREFHDYIVLTLPEDESKDEWEDDEHITNIRLINCEGKDRAILEAEIQSKIESGKILNYKYVNDPTIDDQERAELQYWQIKLDKKFEEGYIGTDPLYSSIDDALKVTIPTLGLNGSNVLDTVFNETYGGEHFANCLSEAINNVFIIPKERGSSTDLTHIEYVYPLENNDGIYINSDYTSSETYQDFISEKTYSDKTDEHNLVEDGTYAEVETSPTTESDEISLRSSYDENGNQEFTEEGFPILIDSAGKKVYYGSNGFMFTLPEEEEDIER